MAAITPPAEEDEFGFKECMLDDVDVEAVIAADAQLLQQGREDAQHPSGQKQHQGQAVAAAGVDDTSSHLHAQPGEQQPPQQQQVRLHGLSTGVHATSSSDTTAIDRQWTPSSTGALPAEGVAGATGSTMVPVASGRQCWHAHSRADTLSLRLINILAAPLALIFVGVWGPGQQI